MQYADKNTTDIQNNEKMENHDFFINLKNILKFVKIRDSSEFVKFVKFAYSSYEIYYPWRLTMTMNGQHELLRASLRPKETKTKSFKTVDVVKDKP